MLRPIVAKYGADPTTQATFARACELAGEDARALEAHAEVALYTGRPYDAMEQLKRLLERYDAQQGKGVSGLNFFQVAGAPNATITEPGQGRGYVFLRPEGGFQAATVAPDAVIGSPANAQDDNFGAAVAVSERNLVVGVPNADRIDAYQFDRIHIAGFE